MAVKNEVAKRAKSPKAKLAKAKAEDKKIEILEASNTGIYDNSYCEKVIEMGKQGYSKYEMALELGIYVQRLRDWQRDRPDFAFAMSVAVAFSRGYWERAGRLGLPSRSFNQNLWLMNMRNRFGRSVNSEDPDDFAWSDRQEVETTFKMAMIELDV